MVADHDIFDVLRRYWGYDSFRPLQTEIIHSVLAGRDTLGLLPTGGGKSITFQVPAMIIDGLTVVITPLISLMKDQVDNLSARGIRAVYLHSGLTRSEHRLAIDRCRLGKSKLLYVSPEKLQSDTFVDTLRALPVKFIVVDEAHCISQWGYDFRPSYLKIGSLRAMFRDAPILALTASATPEVVDDIMDKLAFRERNVWARSFSRDNISYVVRHNFDKERMLFNVLSSTHGSAIVYVRSRRRTREIADMLVKAGISAAHYHAGLAPEDKADRQNRWKNDELRVMVATNAFGMGIDKPDVRVVVHVDVPGSLEEYYQEAGRAGRDGREAYAVLLVSPSDKARLTRMISEAFPPKDFIRRVYELAGNFTGVAVGSGYNSLYEFNFALFTKTYDLPPVATRNALKLLTQAGHFEFVEEISTQSRVMIVCDKEDFYSVRLDAEGDRVFNMLMRSYTGMFADYVYINEELLASRAEVDPQKVYITLIELSRIHILSYIPRKSTPYLYYTSSRQLPKHVSLSKEVYEHQRQRLLRRVEAMRGFAFADSECRVNIMLRYFGESPEEPCGKCDLCRAHNMVRRRSDRRKTDLSESILYIVSRGPQHPDYIINEAPAGATEVIDAIRRLVAEHRLRIEPDGSIALIGK